MRVQDLKRHIYETDQLPTLPVVAQQIMSAANNDDDSLKALSDIVQKDPSLTMKLLVLANAAQYGQQAQVSSVHRAISVVGTEMLRRLALCAFVKAAWANDTRHQLFWKHSIAVAFGTSFLSQGDEDVSADDAFAAGLLHDMGVLVLDTVLADAYQEVEDRITEAASRQEAEQYLLGVDHTQAGSWFAYRWQIPRTLIEGISGHHAEGGSSISRMIRIAERAALSVELGLDGEVDDEPFEQQNEVEAYLQSKGAEIDAFFGTA